MEKQTDRKYLIKLRLGNSLLANAKILTINDFAELATYELIDKDEGILRNLDLEEEAVNKMIMTARENWFANQKEE